MQKSSNQNSLGQRTSQGFAWVLLQTFGVKIVNVIGQIILAYLLLPQDFGKVGLAFTAVAFVSSFQQAGVREILVQRGRKIERWSNTGFWLSIVCGVVGSVLMVVSAPLIARVYKTPSLTPMMWILAASLLISNLGIVPRALLESRFQFKSLSVISAITDTSQMIATLIFAYMKMGAYSFIWAALVASVVKVVLMWQQAKPTVRAQDPFRNWRYLSKNLVSLAISGALTALIWQGDYIVLGITTTPALVGIYFLGFTIAQQAIHLFVYNLSPILLSSLSHLQEDHKKQLNVAIRMGSLLAFIGVPLCLLQAVLAGPFLRLFYADRWQSATIVLAVLSVGMIGRILDPVSESLTNAKGRFNLTLMLAGAHGISLVASLSLVAHSQNLLWISTTVAACLLFFGALRFYCAINLAGGKFTTLLTMFTAPTVLSVLALGIASIVANFLPAATSRMGHLEQIAVVSIVGGVLYLLAAPKTMPGAWQDLTEGVRHIGVARFVPKLKRA